MRCGSIARLGAASAAAAVLTAGAGSAQAACGNAAMRQGASSGLPDCRAYEMVTPVDKEAAGDLVGVQKVKALPAPDRDRVVFQGVAHVFAGTASGGVNDYVVTRGADGWLTRPLAPSDAAGVGYAGRVFNTALDRYAGIASPAKPFEPMWQKVFFGVLGGSLSETSQTGFDGFADAEGISEDGARAVFQTRDHGLASPDTELLDGTHAIYEFTSSGLQLVNVGADGHVVSSCGAVVGNSVVDGRNFGGAQNAVSADGGTVFFESPDPNAVSLGWSSDPACTAPVRLYMRRGGTTVEVSAEQPGVVDPNGRRDVQYAGAAADGSRVYFTTPTRLTADDTNDNPDLYIYDTSDGTLTRASRGDSGTADANVDWVVVSGDGSTAYFAALGALAPGAVAQDVNDPARPINLYRYDALADATTYIGVVNRSDWPVQYANYGAGGGSGPSTRSNWYTTPNGRFLLFSSLAAVAGAPAGGSAQLYRYDAETNTTLCVSCAPDGAPSTSPGPRFEDNETSFVSPAYYAPQGISTDGEYVFFDTLDQLLPADTNSVRDVYEWHNGTLSLLTPGTGSQDSWFFNATPDGHDVFIGTHSQLVPTDVDSSGDIYDARIGGGYPVPPPPRAVCSGDECQGPPSTVPFVSTPASVFAATPAIQGPPGSKVAPKLSVATVTAAQRRALARTGRMALTVRVTTPGRVTVVVSGGIGGRTTVVARSARTLTRAGSAHLAIRLSATAIRQLRLKRHLRLRLQAQLSGAAGAKVATLDLTQPTQSRRAHRS